VLFELHEADRRGMAKGYVEKDRKNLLFEEGRVEFVCKEDRGNNFPPIDSPFERVGQWSVRDLSHESFHSQLDRQGEKRFKKVGEAPERAQGRARWKRAQFVTDANF